MVTRRFLLNLVVVVAAMALLAGAVSAHKDAPVTGTFDKLFRPVHNLIYLVETSVEQKLDKARTDTTLMHLLKADSQRLSQLHKAAGQTVNRSTKGVLHTLASRLEELQIRREYDLRGIGDEETAAQDAS